MCIARIFIIQRFEKGRKILRVRIVLVKIGGIRSCQNVDIARFILKYIENLVGLA